MPVINIYGLPPGDKVDKKISIFDNRFGTAKALRLFVGVADNKGLISFNVPKKYVGKKITLVVNTSEYFSYLKEILVVPVLGVFHTVKLEREIMYDITKPLPVDIGDWYLTSLEQMKIDYRKAKYKNYVGKSASILLTFGAPILGYFIADELGVLLGLFIAIITYLGEKYASGKVKGI